MSLASAIVIGAKAVQAGKTLKRGFQNAGKSINKYEQNKQKAARKAVAPQKPKPAPSPAKKPAPVKPAKPTPVKGKIK